MRDEASQVRVGSESASQLCPASAAGTIWANQRSIPGVVYVLARLRLWRHAKLHECGWIRNAAVNKWWGGAEQMYRPRNTRGQTILCAAERAVREEAPAVEMQRTIQLLEMSAYSACIIKGSLRKSQLF
jgi:hypothetical protein